MVIRAGKTSPSGFGTIRGSVRQSDDGKIVIKMPEVLTVRQLTCIEVGYNYIHVFYIV